MYKMKINRFICKLWKYRMDLRSILWSIYFNFHYLPFKYAIKLPVILYKPHFRKLKGSIDLSPVIKESRGGKIWDDTFRISYCINISKLWNYDRKSWRQNYI